MIPILYEKTETAFVSNGLGRLRDMVSCVVSEERNGIYECDFEYPMTADDFSQIQIGRIIGVTHDDTDDIQPFDIVSYERPIEGVVKFHAVHISYRQSYLTATGSNINSLADAFTLLGNATPTNPFNYQTDKTSSAYFGAADGIPKTVRSMLGGIEGSILDAYGGEFEWDRFNVILHSARGEQKDFAIRYGVNMVDYEEELDISGSYSAVVPYWEDGTNKVVGSRIDSGNSTVTGRGETVPLDLSDKFESKPTKAQVETMARSIMARDNPSLPMKNIHVEFIRLQDLPEYADFARLMNCRLCDTINVVFPDYSSSGWFKIVKTEWDVLADRYVSMELGDLSMTLSEALGITNGLGETVKASDPLPIGSVYVTNSNIDPNGLLGYGTWSLIDKQFTQGGGSTGFTVNSTNASGGSIAWFRNGHLIWMRISFKNLVAISDSDQTWGTINGATLGMSSGAYGFSVGTGYADGLNAIPQVQLTWNGTTGTVKTVDWVTKSTSYPTTTGEPVYMLFIVPVSNTSIADSACDKFFWKRTA